MKCLFCEAKIWDEAKFCTSCGTPVLRCPGCQYPILADAHFCGQCGENLQHHTSLHEDSDAVLVRVTRPAIRATRAQHFSEEIDATHLAILYRPTRVAQRYQLLAGDNTIGANPRNDIVLGDPEVSWNHCLIICRPDRILLQDTASTNGTYINYLKVLRPTPVKSTDTINIASIEFQIWIPDDYEARYLRNYGAP